MSRGLKSYAVGSFLKVSKETVVSWKNKLDPNPDRSEFAVPHLLAYTILKKCIRELNYSPNDLALFNTEKVFKACVADFPVSLRSKVLVLLNDKKEIKLLQKTDDFDWWADDIRFFALEGLVDQFFYDLYFMGVEETDVPSLEKSEYRKSA